MRTNTGIDVLIEALDLGAKVILDPDRPRMLVPTAELSTRLLEQKATVREILRRAIIFRTQAERFLRHGGRLPRLALPAAPSGPCLACGGPLDGGRGRCPVCALAVTIALGGRP